METEPVNRSQNRTVESAVEARQGYLDRPVLLVLVVSIALVLVAFGFLWLPTVL
jgi:hypothetical protein